MADFVMDDVADVVKIGDRISAGQTIGRDQNRASESPGTTNHAHIEVRDASTRNSDSTIRAERDFGQHIDPVKYLQEHYGYAFK
jgi:murein DD-endopeptidase MepM/ murein hydrolase activator NlpD